MFSLKGCCVLVAQKLIEEVEDRKCGPRLGGGNINSGRVYLISASLSAQVGYSILFSLKVWCVLVEQKLIAEDRGSKVWPET